ncbi:hypothetical protein ACFQU7_04575 [Pseudoroseomonas wenyumeiae]
MVEYAGTISRIDSLTVDGVATRLEASGTFGDQLDLALHLVVPEASRISPEVAGPLDLRATAKGPMADPAVTAHLTSPGLTVAGRRLEAPDLQVESPAVMGLTGSARLNARAEGLPVTLALRAAAEGTLIRLQEARGQFGPVDIAADGTFDTATTLFDGTASAKSENLAPLSALAGQPVAGKLDIGAKLVPQDGRQGIDAHARVQQLQAAGQTIAAELTLRGTDAALDFAAKASLPQAMWMGAAASPAATTACASTSRRWTWRRGSTASASLPPAASCCRPAARWKSPACGWRPGPPAISPSPAAGGRNARTCGWPWPPCPSRWPISLCRNRNSAARWWAMCASPARPQPRGECRDQRHRPDRHRPWSRGWPAATLRVEATRNGAGAIRANASLRAGSLANVTAEANLPQGPGTDAPLSATIKGNADLATALAPTLGGGANQVNGRIVMDASASGTLGAPQLGGTVDLTNGTVRNQLYGLRLTNITARLRAQGSGSCWSG